MGSEREKVGVLRARREKDGAETRRGEEEGGR